MRIERRELFVYIAIVPHYIQFCSKKHIGVIKDNHGELGLVGKQVYSVQLDGKELSLLVLSLAPCTFFWYLLVIMIVVL
jgi:hypothetical protein